MTADRIMHRLQKAEWAEPSPWFRQDYRQAYICVSLASKGGQQPFIESSYKIYGTHPDKVWTKIMANRRAKLGKEFSDWYDQAGNLKPDLPKKRSVYTNEEAERFTNLRLAALLMFPKITEARRANVVESGSVQELKKGKGHLYTMPRPSRSTEYQPLRILPVEAEESNAS